MQEGGKQYTVSPKNVKSSLDKLDPFLRMKTKAFITPTADRS